MENWLFNILNLFTLTLLEVSDLTFAIMLVDEALQKYWLSKFSSCFQN